MSTTQEKHSRYGINLRRLMVKFDMDFRAVMAATNLDERTIRGILSGANKPHPATLDKLAEGIGVDVEEFSKPPGRGPLIFDRCTNPIVRDILEAHWDEEFSFWPDEEIEELFSRFATGGALTEEGTLAIVRFMNERREYLAKAKVVFEGQFADILKDLIDSLYSKTQHKTPR